MKKIAPLAAALLLIGGFSGAVPTPALAHDMGAMSDMTMPSGNLTTAMQMRSHMKLTDVRAETPQDIARAQDILATLRRVLLPYRNYKVTLSQGYRIFLPSVPQDVYHFTNYDYAAAEYRGNFNREHPGSLLYTKQPDGSYTLVGAMYSAPPDFTQDQLNELIPLSIARWHEHVDICLPSGITLNDLIRGDVGAGQDLPGMIPIAANPEAFDRDQKYGVFADGRFGFTGTIDTKSACQAAGGHFLPLAFGWMVHVYPFSGNDLKVAFGMSVPKVISSR